MRLSDFKALTFDCYGTLIDWESGMISGLKKLTEQRADLTRNNILEAHARFESGQQAQTPYMNYRDVLSIVYKRLAEEWGLEKSQSDCDEYGHSVEHWPVFPDSADALKYLSQHYKLIILSNVDNKSFAYSNKKLGVNFDAIYSAQDVGAYKPSDRNFTYMLKNLESLGIAKDDILHTAESLFHDHVPASRHGLATAWIYRRHADQGFGATMHPGRMPKTTFRFISMSEMVEAHKQEQQ